MRSKENVGLQITVNKQLLKIMDATIEELNKLNPDEPKVTRSMLIHDCLVTVLLGAQLKRKADKKEA